MNNFKLDFKKLNLDSNKNVLAFAVAVTLLLALYTYFSDNFLKGNSPELDTNFQTEEIDISASSTIRDSDDEMLSDSPENQNLIWTANDYEMGDVLTGNYTVTDGDTLWEIAEGAYGDGSLWTEILNANQSDVEFLSTGQQALIYPGQILIIPQLN